jgi:hypothetical protein
MKHFYFFLGLMTSVLLLSACQSSRSNINIVGDPSVPPQTFCEGRMAWSAEVTTDDIVSYTTFWIAFDAATVQDEFQYIQVDVTLDGKSVAQEMKYMAAPEPYSVTCPESGQQFAASRVKYTLILPSLSSGEHNIFWNYTITADPNEGVFNYSHGMPAEHSIKRTIER